MNLKYRTLYFWIRDLEHILLYVEKRPNMAANNKRVCSRKTLNGERRCRRGFLPRGKRLMSTEKGAGN
jgi:hypothetical protein